MNQPVRPDTDSRDTFESAIAQLLERIRKTKWARSQLEVIVTDGLKAANKIDTDYEDDESFSLFKLHLLYKVAFEVWSYQHQAILESLKANKSAQISNNSQLVLHHQTVVINMFNELNKLADVKDPNLLRNSWLSVWKQTFYEFEDFLLQIPMTSLIRAGRPKTRGLGMILSSISPTAKYAILSTFLLLLAIVIATKLLIR